MELRLRDLQSPAMKRALIALGAAVVALAGCSLSLGSHTTVRRETPVAPTIVAATSSTTEATTTAAAASQSSSPTTGSTNRTASNVVAGAPTSTTSPAPSPSTVPPQTIPAPPTRPATTRTPACAALGSGQWQWSVRVDDHSGAPGYTYSGHLGPGQNASSNGYTFSVPADGSRCSIS